MGRTVPTFTNLIDYEMASWSKYRRGLRKEDQSLFDDLFRAAKRHVAENFYMMRSIPFESISMAMMLEQRRLIKCLEDRVTELDDARKEIAKWKVQKEGPAHVECHHGLAV